MAITFEEKQMLVRMRKAGYTYQEISRVTGRTVPSLQTHMRIIEGTASEAAYLNASPYPVYNDPLRMEGDALIIADPEFPYHHAEFLNRVIDLAVTWGIDQLIIAGDALHFDSLSAWGAHWVEPAGGGFSDEQEAAFMDFLSTLPSDSQAAGVALLEEIGKASPGDGMSEEVAVARRELGRLGREFRRVDYVIGNHDDRFLRALNSPIFAGELLRVLELPEPKWRIAPYYFSYLESSGELFRIEHPNGTAKTVAARLASKYLCHVIMAHNHVQTVERDLSGTFWAINAGHTVDEERLAYAAQRSNGRPAHNLGAVVVRDGFPYVLNPQTPWDQYKKMR